MREGHEFAAAALCASAVVAGAAAGPLWATAFELASAAVTAGIAAHAIEDVARDADASAQNVLLRVARREAKRPRAALAAQALDVACRVHTRDPRALRSAAMLLGQASSAHARGIAVALTTGWCSPLRAMFGLGAPAAAARAARDGAAFVRSMRQAARAALRPAPSADVAVLIFEKPCSWEAAA
jgi:hypothetical protein